MTDVSRQPWAHAWRFVPSFLAVLAAATPAAAHAILIEGQPSQGEVVVAGPAVIHLRYNSRIDHRRSRVTLTAPDGRNGVLSLKPDDQADMLTAATELVPGPYTLHWQVLAVDGHITRGDVGFTVTPRP